MSKLILLRHGESMWNQKNVFTGWVDVPLSQKGIDEAIRAGKTIQDMPIDRIFCSTLIRGVMTAMLAMAFHHGKKTPVILHKTGKMKEWATIASPKEIEQTIPVICTEELNERMYGNLQGLNKRQTMDTYGEEQVKAWRRSYKISPPGGESLEKTAQRTIPYFQQVIQPFLEKGENVFISAHGNSLRAIVKFIDNLSDDEVVLLEIATGVPFFYEYADGRLQRVSA